jgi:hypothetical protein
MAGMNQLLERPWMIVAVLAVVFLAALSMHMERMAGWGFLVLCFVVGSLGGLAVIFTRNKTLSYWSQLPKSRRRIVIATAIPLVLVVTFVANRHKPDEFANDALTCFTVLLVLLFWGYIDFFPVPRCAPCQIL